jgi:hypothetical protein
MGIEDKLSASIWLRAFLGKARQNGFVVYLYACDKKLR